MCVDSLSAKHRVLALVRLRLRDTIVDVVLGNKLSA